jgi:acyl-coenzyme A synthetase/AMP-(fatty) acid ligase
MSTGGASATVTRTLSVPSLGSERFRYRQLGTSDADGTDADGCSYVVDRENDMISADGCEVGPREVGGVLPADPAVRR